MDMEFVKLGRLKISVERAQLAQLIFLVVQKRAVRLLMVCFKSVTSKKCNNDNFQSVISRVI